jgi:lysozyme
MCEIGKNKVDAQFFEFLKEEEGFENKEYTDSEGNLTIGIGHLLTETELKTGYIAINDVKVYYKNGITDDHVVNLCIQDTDHSVHCVNRFVTVKLSQNQFNALVSFCYNIGALAFRKSTLLKKLNSELYEEVPFQMKRWVYDNNKKIVKGLVNRRNSEVKLWMK